MLLLYDDAVTDDPELQVAEAIGRLMSFWGFRKNLGRIWALLFLSPQALTAPELCERLKLSTGSVSMALGELQRWGAINKRSVPGDRRDHYEVEADIWGTLSRIMAQREAREIDRAIVAFQTVGELLDARAAVGGEDDRYRAARLAELTGLAVSGKDLLRLLLAQGSVADLVPEPGTKPRRRPLIRLPRAPLDDGS